MNTYKVGDRVKRIKASHEPDLHGYYGNYYTVKALDDFGNPIIIGNWACNKDSFEIVEEENLLKYEVGKAYFWEGGANPLPKTARVVVRYGTRDFNKINPCWEENINFSEAYNWEHDYPYDCVVMFKVVSYPVPKPVKRDVTLKLTDEQLELIKTLLKENEA